MYFPAIDRSGGAKLPTHDLRTFNTWSHCWIFLPWGSFWMGTYSPWDKSYALPVIINKVLLEPRHVHSSSMAACPLSTVKEYLWQIWYSHQALQRMCAGPCCGRRVCAGSDCSVNTEFCVSIVSFSHIAWRSLINISEVIEWIWAMGRKLYNC